VHVSVVLLRLNVLGGGGIVLGHTFGMMSSLVLGVTEMDRLNKPTPLLGRAWGRRGGGGGVESAAFGICRVLLCAFRGTLW